VDLAAELLKAAALVAEQRPQRFSLREAARRARVSEAAPYWHFANKEALLAGVAEQRFSALAALMAKVRRRVKDSHRQLSGARRGLRAVRAGATDVSSHEAAPEWPDPVMAGQ